jgi:kumamolisin
MATKVKTVSVPGSKKAPFRNAKVVGPAPANERLEVTVRLRAKNPLPNPNDMLNPSTAPIPQLTHQEFEEKYGTSAEDIAKIREFANANNLVVVTEDPGRRSVMLAGTVADFNRAFGQKLMTYAHATGTYRGRTGTIKIPAELDGVIEGVFGLDNRPVASRHAPRPKKRGVTKKAAAATASPFTPVQLAKIYNFPTGADGTGQTIAIIELGGGYFPADLEQYFASLKLPVPTVIPVSVDGANNSPTTAGSDDAEVVLDIEVAGAVAPGAQIVVYFAPNEATSKGFLDALTKAVHDTQFNPSVISISWGGPEDPSNANFQTQFDQVLQEAALLGVTVCIASGDDGAADMGPKVWDGLAHVDFPASSPFALACGGTRLIASGSSISSESVWNHKTANVSANAGPDGSFDAGGGGVSGAFPIPAYQNQANVPVSLNPAGFKGRGVPDVSGDADPDTGYKIQVDSQQIQEGGTSAVAPLWAGLIARINQKLNGRVGFINPQIYALAAGSAVFHDVTTGNNRVSFKKFKNVGYDAGTGWDACSGLGSVDGTQLSQVLTVGSQPPTAKRVSRRKAKAATTA